MAFQDVDVQPNAVDQALVVTDDKSLEAPAHPETAQRHLREAAIINAENAETKDYVNEWLAIENSLDPTQDRRDAVTRSFDELLDANRQAAVEMMLFDPETAKSTELAHNQLAQEIKTEAGEVAAPQKVLVGQFSADPTKLTPETRERLAVRAGTVVGRDLHADQQGGTATRAHHFHHVDEICANLFDRIAAQTVVAAEFDNDDVGRVGVERTG